MARVWDSEARESYIPNDSVWVLGDGIPYTTGTCSGLPLDVCTLDRNCAVRNKQNYKAACVRKPGSRVAPMDVGSAPNARIDARVTKARRRLSASGHMVRARSARALAALGITASATAALQQELQRGYAVRTRTDQSTYNLLGEPVVAEDPDDAAMERMMARGITQAQWEARTRRVLDEIDTPDPDADAEEAYAAEDNDLDTLALERERALVKWELEAAALDDDDEEDDDEDDDYGGM